MTAQKGGGDPNLLKRATRAQGFLGCFETRRLAAFLACLVKIKKRTTPNLPRTAGPGANSKRKIFSLGGGAGPPGFGEKCWGKKPPAGPLGPASTGSLATKKGVFFVSEVIRAGADPGPDGSGEVRNGHQGGGFFGCEMEGRGGGGKPFGAHLGAKTRIPWEKNPFFSGPGGGPGRLGVVLGTGGNPRLLFFGRQKKLASRSPRGFFFQKSGPGGVSGRGFYRAAGGPHGGIEKTYFPNGLAID